MFWGQVLNEDKPINLSSFSIKGDILHLSHLTLHDSISQDQILIFLTTKGQKHPLAILSKAKPFADLNLYFQTNTNSIISVQGKGEVSISGYFPPTI